MALIGEDLIAENILDEPDELELIQEGGDFHEEPGIDIDNENEGAEDEDKENPKDKKDENKKKRNISQKPKLNILRLTDNKIGLIALENSFKNVHYKGKGHEREDLNLIMRKMEIWAHQLYPSLQFDDCLAKLEKLGANRGVSTYMKRIRMGLDWNMPNVDDTIDKYDNEAEELPSSANNDAFDQLLNTQNRQTGSMLDDSQIQPTNITTGLTAEQRERMLRNRLIAEQRRMARMKARQQQQESVINVNDTQEAIVMNDNENTYNDVNLNQAAVSNRLSGIVEGVVTVDDAIPDSSKLGKSLVSEGEEVEFSFNGCNMSEAFIQSPKSVVRSESELLVCNSSNGESNSSALLIDSNEKDLQNDMALQVEEKLLHSDKSDYMTNLSTLEKTSGNPACNLYDESEEPTHSGQQSMQIENVCNDSIQSRDYVERKISSPGEPMSVEIDL